LAHDGTSAGDLNQFTGGGLTLGDQRPDTKLWYLVGGISRNWFGMGKTALYGEYARLTDGASGLIVGAGLDEVSDSDITMWGLGVVQNIDAAAMELFLSYRQYQADITTTGGGNYATGNLNDMNILMAGARIKF
jgi:hypothetical protein